MSFGFGFGFTKITAAIRAAFSPSSLFAANEPGVWYDPSDFSTMFQDAAGTTPVTAVEQPVGLMLDKSKGLVLGPELVTNGTFGTDISGWNTPENSSGTLVWSSNAMRVTRAGSVAAGSQGISVTSGKTYKVSCTFSVVSGAGVGLYLLFKTTDNANGLTSGSSTKTASAGSSGTLTFIYTAASTTTLYLMGLLFGGGVGAVDFDNISVREIPGNHAYQTTATSRPVLSARYNLLTKTEQFDDAVWGKTAVSLDATLVTAPNGTLTAYKATTSSDPRLTQNFTAQAVPYQFSVYLRSTSGTLRVPIAIVGGDGSTVAVSFSVTVTTQWQQFSVYSATAVAGANARVQIFSGATSVGTVVEVWGADLRVANDGANLPPYQRVNTATDYDTAGFPHYLRFDGVDDWLVTNTITPGIDKAQVFAGVRKLSDAAVGIIYELSLNFATTAGSFLCSINDNGKAYLNLSRGNAGPSYLQGGFIQTAVAPDTAVLTNTHDISGDLSTMRRNAVAGTNGTADQGTGNYGNYPLYIGRRGGTEIPFNGRLYSLIVRFGSNLPIATLEKIEKYVNTKTRAY